MSVRRRVILGTSILVLALAAAYLMKGGGAGGGVVATQPEQPAAVGVVSAVEIDNSAHPDCRYSMVPGGLYSPDEVRKAIEQDAVIAAHFAGVEIGSLREARAGEGRRVFVSYRIRNEVFWSREQVALEPGEKILTDGHTEIRARCGNLVSDGSHLSAEASAGLPALYNELDKIETDSSTTANGAAAADDAIEPPGSTIVLPAPDQILVNPGIGTIEPPSRTAPWLFVSGGISGSTGTGSSDGAGSGGGTASGAGGSGGGGGGAGGGGGIAGGGSIGGGTDTGGGSSGGVGSGDAVGGADSGRSGGGSGGSGEGGGGTPNLGIGPDGPGSGDGGGSSSQEGEPGSGNPGGPGGGGPGNGNPTFVVVDQSGPGSEQQPVHVPEPATLSLLAIGVGAAALAERRRARRR